MPLSIRNEKTVALARRVAASKGLSVTQAIHDALERESISLSAIPPLPPETQAFLAQLHGQIRASSTRRRNVDKAFFDSLNDE